MIKVLTACTTELDDVALAVAEILEQLDLSHNLRRHSVGIVACYQEFLEIGILGALRENLPFDVVGANTLVSACPHGAGQMQFSLMVITSDEVTFVTGISDPLENGQEPVLEKLYTQIAARQPAAPALILSYAPVSAHFNADGFVAQLTHLSGGQVPIFGTLAADYASSMRTPRVIFNGEVYDDRLAIIAISGDIHPEFRLVSLNKSKILKRKATVTASEGSILKEINEMPASQYLSSLGLIKEGKVPINAIPLVVQRTPEVPPVVRALTKCSEEGHAFLAGDAPVGSTLSIGSIDRDDVISTASQFPDQIELEQYHCALIASCVVRNFVLGLDNMDEVALIQSHIGDKIPYLFSYSSGEICPARMPDGQWFNCYNNMAIMCCVF
jgi:hypothetical protein